MRAPALLLLLLPAALNAAQMNVSGPDGAVWKSLDTNLKLAMLSGYMMGYNAGGGDILSVWVQREHIQMNKIGRTEPESDPTSIPLGQIMAGMDECYKDFRNEHVPIAGCMDWVVAGVRGASEKQRNTILENQRRLQSMVEEEERKKR